MSSLAVDAAACSSSISFSQSRGNFCFGLLLQACVSELYLLVNNLWSNRSGELERLEDRSLDVFVFVVEVDEERLADILEGAVRHAQLREIRVRLGN